MDYEICLKLRNANFPQDWRRFDDHDKDLLVRDWEMYKNNYCPDIADLLTALGEVTLIVQKEGCMAVNNVRDITDPCRGKTPEEALASLWLSLHPSKI